MDEPAQIQRVRFRWAGPLMAAVSIAAVGLVRTRAVAALHYSLEPIREYRSLAWKILLVSFGPDIALALGHWFGGGWSEALVLMTMHVVVWAICVTMLPALAAAKWRSDSARQAVEEALNPRVGKQAYKD